MVRNTHTHTNTRKSHATDSLNRQWNIRKHDTQTMQKHTHKTNVENTHNRFIKNVITNTERDTQTIRKHAKKHTPHKQKRTQQVHRKQILAMRKNDTQTIRAIRANHTQQMQKTHTARSWKGIGNIQK